MAVSEPCPNFRYKVGTREVALSDVLNEKEYRKYNEALALWRFKCLQIEDYQPRFPSGPILKVINAYIRKEEEQIAARRKKWEDEHPGQKFSVLDQLRQQARESKKS